MTERQEEEILRESGSPLAPPPLSRVPGTLCLCVSASIGQAIVPALAS